MKQLQFKITKGMNQDLSNQASSPDTAFKLLNIKNQILDSGSGEALMNEKGTLLTKFYKDKSIADKIDGEVLGIVTCSSGCVVVFVRTVQEEEIINIIYRVKYKENDTIEILKIAEGKFNLGDNIKGIFCYENSELQKVYWVDGVNQLRYINIADSNFISVNINGKLPITEEIYIDSSPEFKLEHEIKVERIAGGGIFTAGVIQYAFTYYMKNGAETSIVDMTPLYYVSETDGGLLADESVGCSFRITINNTDTRYDYLRLYSIQRTSLNGTPIVRIVKDVKLK